jgi:UDP:flavonoid glycosyltransferase YjiC (YdhE family)
MKFVLACCGMRGDVEPFAAVGRELLRRGHDVHMAVPPNLVGFAESVGLEAVGYGLDWSVIMEVSNNFWSNVFRNSWRIQNQVRFVRETWELAAGCWGEMSSTLTSLADGADLVFTGQSFEAVAANVAEYHDIPLATLHYAPIRLNGELLPSLPAPLVRSAITVNDWLFRCLTKKIEDAQRRELGLPKATGPFPRRITERGSLEIQAYDEVCFPGLAAEWAKWNGQRPFVGPLTMELQTDADDEVASWIAAGTPPIYFGFGSISVGSPGDVPHFDHVKVVGAINFAATFPACRAVVHHGGSGTTAAGLRAGVPTLILQQLAGDQPFWAAAVKRLKVGTARRLSTTTRESLVADLRTILAPQYVTRAREVATRMTKPAENVAAVADLVENFARLRRVG